MVIKGPDGVRLVEPSDVADKGIGLRELYEAGRLYGRYEADNAITWHTACVKCAGRLDAHADGFFRGERSGLAVALRAIDDSASANPDVQATIDVIRAKIARLLAQYPQEGT